jgi:cytochrome c peroxidase
MTASQKRGAVLFFGKADCVSCHAVGGKANEMFSDFENHVVGVPQIAPEFGVDKGNVKFDGPGQNEDFGAEQISGEPQDRYKFRTSPLRNVAVQSSFFHNGAFTTLEDAVWFHLNAAERAPRYDPIEAGVDEDLTYVLGPIEPVLERLSPLLKRPVKLTDAEFDDLIAFLREGIFDPRALPEKLCKLVPPRVPSGKPLLKFEGCPQ